MNRRDFLKGSIASLASVWMVAASKENIVAEEPVVKEKTEEKEEEFREFPASCSECFRYFCGPECPHYVQPYFADNGFCKGSVSRVWLVE